MDSPNKNKTGFVVGFQEEWQDFEKRNALFLERFHHLQNVVALAFNRDAQFSESIDRFVMMYGGVCFQDFMEILLCCGNGNGHAAEKLLRGLYERAVTLRYLHEHPIEFDDFFDFFYVGQRKLMIACNNTMGGEVFSRETADEIEKNYQNVKERFMVTDCEKCGTKRPNHTWSKLDFVSMASKTALGKLIVPAYFMPLRQAHATVGSMLSRMAPGNNDGILFVDEPQRKVADNAMRVSHNVFLDVLRVQDEHFALPGLKEQNDICLQDFMDMWQQNTKT